MARGNSTLKRGTSFEHCRESLLPCWFTSGLMTGIIICEGQVFLGGIISVYELLWVCPKELKQHICLVLQKRQHSLDLVCDTRTPPWGFHKNVLNEKHCS